MNHGSPYAYAIAHCVEHKTNTTPELADVVFGLPVCTNFIFRPHKCN
jgi:hypothetical protein